MPSYKIFKETAVPAQIEANAIYLVAPAAQPGVLEVYVSDASGTATRKALDAATVQTMIDAAIQAGSGGLVIVDDLAARDQLVPTNGTQALVIDASADAAVDAGTATYVWRESTTSWIKIAESESMDLSLAWAGITGRPTSSPAQIDAAVTASHSHANKTQLDALGEDEDQQLTYRGQRPTIAWSSTNW